MYHLCAALLQTPTCSDILLVWDVPKCLPRPSWLDIAAHLGCSSDYIMNMHESEISIPSHVADNNYKRFRIQMSAEWLARKKGTGDRPRTWKTVLEAFKKCCAHTEGVFDELSRFEDKLVRGDRLYPLMYEM